MTEKAMALGQKRLYIVISQSGTLPSKMLRAVTGAKYNHVSISLADDLGTMYSFGRRRTYNPFWGGFVMESPHAGTFKRFPDTKIILMSVPITEEQGMRLKARLEKMYEHRLDYHYNYLGLFLAGIHIYKKFKRHYYCSEFVREMLVEFKIDGAKDLPRIIHPMEFEEMASATEIYRGLLRDFGTSSPAATVK